ncbi:MAG: tetratricopeptide repeat protein [Tepidisphaeraceae bacterium]|jgi:tetratricopeptide (TPR) repeat protein
MRYALSGLILICLVTSGCSSDQQRIQDEVEAGEVALGGNQYDSAVSHADEALHIGANARAYYLRARAEEDRPKPSDSIAAADLAKAKDDYTAAFTMHPGQPLEARARAGLANVAFSTGDYAVAAFQWETALDDLDMPEYRALALYRIGECQQRLGRFDDADKTFDRLIQQYPDQDVATKAQARKGVRGFYLQLGAFAKMDDAQAAIKKASDAGLFCRPVSDQGLIAVRGGPYYTYADAEKAKATVATQFTDPIIGP